ncbi:putative ATP-dependent RNA helicase dhx33 [Borealophlyctis nickersoniae]|nr:putative ATP-dependent RNA helicase dhx33 [Borealophlyctis nickersoniae]
MGKKRNKQHSQLNILPSDGGGLKQTLPQLDRILEAPSDPGSPVNFPTAESPSEACQVPDSSNKRKRPSAATNDHETVNGSVKSVQAPNSVVKVNGEGSPRKKPKLESKPNTAHQGKKPKLTLEEKARSLKPQRDALPITAAKKSIVDAIRTNQSVVIVGETGSGKTTQIPQFLQEAGLTKKGMIAVTQPRRVAAISIAKRVAEESATKLGDKVGYSIRFEDVTSPQTLIKYMTDGMLLRELLSDSNLSRYSVIVLDEAHERTLRTDILFGMVKAIQRKRKDLKVVVMSATLNAEAFSAFFDNAKVLFVAGRQFPVRMFHTVSKQEDYVDAALVATFQLHVEQPQGDILVFLTGQEEIEALTTLLNDASRDLPPNCPGMLVCPIFASLPTAQQTRVFEPAPPGTRKIILSTNIAETSITISGVRYVVDTGMVKMRGYNPKIGIESLTVQPISKASARQRTGRAGREAPGCCYRLFTEEAFNKLPDDSEPEIMRCNLASVLLLLKASGVDDVLGFDYMDKPSRTSIIRALENLYALGALKEDGKLSNLGRQMAEFPLDPPFAKVIIQSKKYKCTQEVISIVSLLSVDPIFFSPHEKREEAAAAKKKFINYDGDHITLLNVMKGYQSVHGDREWCNENFVSGRSMKQVMDIRTQLQQFCSRYLQIDPTTSCGTDFEPVLKCFLSGFFQNVALIQHDGTYRTLVSNQIVHIHPTSTLFNRKAHAIMYGELVHTTRHYVRNCSIIQPGWVTEAAPGYYGKREV